MYASTLRSILAHVPCVLALALALPLSAQTPAAPPTSLAVRMDLPPETFDPEALRAAIERELGVPIERVTDAPGTHLNLWATTPSAVRVKFVRPDGTTVERTVDVSTSGPHVNDTLALLAANMVADEAGDLLATLRANQPAPPPPPPAAAPSPPPPPPPPAPEPKGCDENELRKLAVGLDVLPYVGMSSRHGTTVERKLSLNLFGGVTGAVRGMEFSLFVNLDGHSVCGLQITGGANLVSGPVDGAQIGMLNWAKGRGDGAQFGLANGVFGGLSGAQFGLANIAGRDIYGAQFGLANVGGGWLYGAQFGLANVAGDYVRGGQFALANVSGGELTGIQAGLANVASLGVEGTQLGLVNVSGAHTRGFQAGLVNVSAGRVDGAMIGLVNTAEDADVAIGLLNVLWNGRTHLDVWGTDFGMYMIGIEHGSRIFHNITGFGVGDREDHLVFGPTFGMGARVVNLPFLWVDIDALAYGMFVHDKANSRVDGVVVSQLRIPVAWRIIPEIAVFVSPAINVSVTQPDTYLLADPSLIGSTRLTNDGSGTEVRIWPGFTVGARFL